MSELEHPEFSMTREVKWHPGEILMEEWLAPMGLSQYALAKAIDVPPRRINEIVKAASEEEFVEVEEAAAE